MKILLVDDESSLLKIGKIFLIKNNPNFDITGSHSAKDALKLLEKKSYDIIISDYQMPEMNGLEFLKEVKEKDSNIPFIMFTGKGREEVAIDALNLGANRYIQKGGDAKTQYGILSQAIINEYNHSFTQKKLVNSEEQYRTLVETMHDGIVSVDTSGVIEFVNEKFCKMIGYSTEELLYTNITNYYDEENQRIVREQLNLRTKGTAKPYEIEWTKKNGDKIITINSPNILYNKDDEHVGSFSVIKDVAELKRVKTALSQREKELIYQSKLDALLADISTRSINLEYDKTDQEIVHILQKMCEFFMFDSGVITRYHNDIRDVDETYFTNTHEYIRGHDPNRGVIHEKYDYILRKSHLPWLYDKIRAIEPFQIADIDTLPTEAKNWKNILEGFGAKSIHYFPLVIKGKLTGIIIFQSTKPLKLKEFQMNKIKIVSDIIQSILESRIDKRELVYQSELDALLAEISTRSINLESAKTDQEIVLILQQICDFFKFDNSVITRYQDDLRDVDETSFTKTHEFIRGHDPNRDLTHEKYDFKLQESHLPWLYNKIRAIEPFQIADIDTLPTEAKNWKNILEGYGAKSIHLFPLVIKEKLTGLLSFQTISPLKLTEFQMNKIKIISDIIQSILESRVTKRELIYQSELDTLLYDISIRLVYLESNKIDQEIGLILQKICDFFVFDSAVIIKYQEDLRYANESLFSRTHEFIRGHDPNIGQIYENHNYKIQEGALPWYLNMMRTLEPFQIADTNKLPPEASDLKEALDKFGSRSIHYFPLVIKEKLSGMLTFQSTFPLDLKGFQMKKIVIVCDIIQSLLERSLITEK